MALIIILSKTIFHSTQAFLELCLIFMLTFLLLKRKLKIWEIILLLLVVVTQLMSVLIYDNSVTSFMFNTKMAGLAFLSLIYFRHNATISVSMKVFFIVCLSLILIQYFITHNFPIPIPESLMKNLTIYNHPQPLGLFLDFHDSAYFLAVYFIGINLTRKLFFIDVLIIWLTGVRTSFLALIGQKFFNTAGKRFYIFKKASVQITILIVGVLLLLTVFLPLFFSVLDIFHFGAGDSFTIMSQLIVNPNVYLDVLNFFPTDLLQYHITYYYDAGVGSKLSGELVLINIMVMFGTPIGLFFLYYMLKFTPSFRVFILLSLLHSGAILNPLFIYLVFMFENQARQIKEK